MSSVDILPSLELSLKSFQQMDLELGLLTTLPSAGSPAAAPFQPDKDIELESNVLHADAFPLLHEDNPTSSVVGFNVSSTISSLESSLNSFEQVDLSLLTTLLSAEPPAAAAAPFQSGKDMELEPNVLHADAFPLLRGDNPMSSVVGFNISSTTLFLELPLNSFEQVDFGFLTTLPSAPAAAAPFQPVKDMELETNVLHADAFPLSRGDNPMSSVAGFDISATISSLELELSLKSFEQVGLGPLTPLQFAGSPTTAAPFQQGNCMGSGAGAFPLSCRGDPMFSVVGFSISETLPSLEPSLESFKQVDLSFLTTLPSAGSLTAAAPFQQGDNMEPKFPHANTFPLSHGDNPMSATLPSVELSLKYFEQVNLGFLTSLPSAELPTVAPFQQGFDLSAFKKNNGTVFSPNDNRPGTLNMLFELDSWVG